MSQNGALRGTDGERMSSTSHAGAPLDDDAAWRECASYEERFIRPAPGPVCQCGRRRAPGPWRPRAATNAPVHASRPIKQNVPFCALWGLAQIKGVIMSEYYRIANIHIQTGQPRVRVT